MADSAAAEGTPASFYWYDLETSGTHPPSDRIMQLASLRTDANLMPLGEAYARYVRLSEDVLPSPEACLVSAITPQFAAANGEDEWRVLSKVSAHLREPGSCLAGYNNLRFDDDFLRHGFYRNLIDPYAHEWQDGNSRWDLIDVVRAACALRPEGIHWPADEGVVTFKLSRITAANGIAHDTPHGAMSDVQATIGLARLLKSAQPKLWNFALAHRHRSAVQSLLLPLGRKLCVHVSRRYANEVCCAAPVVSVAAHPQIGNRLIVADLSRDVSALIECDSGELAERLFAKSTEANAVRDDERPPLKVVVLNRCPFVAPIAVVRRDDAARLGFDLDVVRRRMGQLAGAPELAEKIAEVYRRDEAPTPGQDSAQPARFEDAEFALYDGFVDDADRRRTERLQAALVASQGEWPSDFKPQDERLVVLAERLKARLNPLWLNAEELKRWQTHVRRCLDEGFGERPSLAEFKAQVETLLAEQNSAQAQRLLGELASAAP